MLDELVLTVDGQEFRGWQKISVSRTMGSLCGSFTVSYTQPEITAPPIRVGSACTVRIDDALVLTGYVDDLNVSYAKSVHALTVNGRDKTADLVDCSATVEHSGEWVNSPLQWIARDVCEPYGIRVVSAVRDEDIAKAAVEEGETAFEFLERLARQQGLLLATGAEGQLLITRSSASPKSTATIFQEGVNILGAAVAYSGKDRFSDYIVKGTHQGSDALNGEDAASPLAQTQDPNVRRYRPHTVIAEDNSTLSSLKIRAAWERNTRFSKGVQFSISVVGWRDDAGQLWEVGTLARLVSPRLYIDAELLISSVAFKLGAGGSTTELKLTGKQAFDLLPPEPVSEAVGA